MGKSPGYDWILGGQLPELGRHSVAKHEVFDRYIAAYVRTLTKNHLKRALNLTIVDGFCGGVGTSWKARRSTGRHCVCWRP